MGVHQGKVQLIGKQRDRSHNNGDCRRSCDCFDIMITGCNKVVKRKKSWMGYKARSHLVLETRSFVLLTVALIIGGIILIVIDSDLGLENATSTIYVGLFVLAAKCMVVLWLCVPRNI